MNKGMVISVEIIHLLKWIIEHGKEGLDALIAEAIEAGCLEIDDQLRFDGTANAMSFQKVIVDMIAFFENSVDEHVSGVLDSTPAAQRLVDYLQNTRIDQGLVLDAIRTTTLHLKNSKSGKKMLQEDVFKKMLLNLLKSWKPSKDDAFA